METVPMACIRMHALSSEGVSLNLVPRGPSYPRPAVGNGPNSREQGPFPTVVLG